MMMSAEVSRRQTLTTLTTLFLLGGLLLIAVSGMVRSYGLLGVCETCTPPVPQNQGQLDAQRFWAPVVWNLGMFLLIFGIWGTALMRQDMDPMARLLLYLVAFIVILLIFTVPSLLFTNSP